MSTVTGELKKALISRCRFPLAERMIRSNPEKPSGRVRDVFLSEIMKDASIVC